MSISTAKKTEKALADGQKGCVFCFSSLGVGSRMKIYQYLKKKGKSTVSAIVKLIGLTQPTVSYHLNEMRSYGILKSQRVGKEVYYDISGDCAVYGKDCVLKEVNFPSKHA
jgi:DNA-binding transcriptional ArsR family regulator